MRPSYTPDAFKHITLDEIKDSTPWIQVTEARLECFMSYSTETYTYGSGKGVRTYTPTGFSKEVENIMHWLNIDDVVKGKEAAPKKYNVCFLNRYDNAQMQLGWHSDDSPGMNHEHPIAVGSFGQQREIWWREIEQKGVIPQDQRQLLEHGSLFVMPPGFQRTYQHRIPKGDRPMGCRVSLTFRNYIPEVTNG